MKAYLAAPIFTERDRNFNAMLEHEIKTACPEMDLYLSQNNLSINDKTKCAGSADIYVGDIQRLKAADMLICVVSGDVPPIGTTCEYAYFAGLCEKNPKKRIVALYDDSRDGSHTFVKSKLDMMLSGNAENQWSYINLLAVGFLKKWGTICHTSDELIEEVKKQYNIGFNDRVCGIYKITNLKNNQCYIGCSNDIYGRWRGHKNGNSNLDISNDIAKLGEDYFKFEILEVCTEEDLSVRESYYIEYYDTYYSGYNNNTGNFHGRKDDSVKSCSCYDLDGNKINTFFSTASAARFYDMKSQGDIYRSISSNNNVLCKGMQWAFGEENNISKYEKPIRSNGTVYCYDALTKELCGEFESAAVAAKNLKLSHAHISGCLNNKRRTTGGLIWSYEKYDRILEDKFV